MRLSASADQMLTLFNHRSCRSQAGQLLENGIIYPVCTMLPLAVADSLATRSVFEVRATCTEGHDRFGPGLAPVVRSSPPRKTFAIQSAASSRTMLGALLPVQVQRLPELGVDAVGGQEAVQVARARKVD